MTPPRDRPSDPTTDAPDRSQSADDSGSGPFRRLAESAYTLPATVALGLLTVALVANAGVVGPLVETTPQPNTPVTHPVDCPPENDATGPAVDERSSDTTAATGSVGSVDCDPPDGESPTPVVDPSPVTDAPTQVASCHALSCQGPPNATTRDSPD